MPDFVKPVFRTERSRHLKDQNAGEATAKETRHGSFSFANYFGEINILANLQLDREAGRHALLTGYPQSDLDWQNARTILRAIPGPAGDPGLELFDIVNPAAIEAAGGTLLACAVSFRKQAGGKYRQKAKKSRSRIKLKCQVEMSGRIKLKS